jgi:hypothetical protein
MQRVSAQSGSAGQRVIPGYNRTRWYRGRTRGTGKSGREAYGVRSVGSAGPGNEHPDMDEQPQHSASVLTNRPGSGGDEPSHRRYGSVLFSPDIRRAEPEMHATSGRVTASAATSGQAASGNREYESDNGRRENRNRSGDASPSSASSNDTEGPVSWLENILRPHIEREFYRIKARDALANLPPPAPMIKGPNVLVRNPASLRTDVLREAEIYKQVAVPKIQKRTETDMPLVVMILGVVGQLVDGLISNGMKAGWPKDLIDAIVAASSAIGQAHGLAVTKAQLESARQVSASPTA